jgi:hypothetical protein
MLLLQDMANILNGNKLFYFIFFDATAQRRPGPPRKLIILRAVITKPINPRNSVAEKNLPNHFFVLSFCFFYYCPLFNLLYFCSFILSCFSFLCSFLLHLHLLFLLILTSPILHSPFQTVKMWCLYLIRQQWWRERHKKLVHLLSKEPFSFRFLNP